MTRNICTFLFVAMASSFAVAAPQGFPDAADSDPRKMGWMVGAPPPPDRLIRFDDASFLKFPQLRWSFSHWRELFSTVEVSRGDGPASPLPRADRADIDQGVTFMPLGGAQPMTWSQSLAANYTDGILVMHRGRVVYERYFGALKPDGLHIAHSVTKSFAGTIAAMLVAEGKLDADAKVSHYLPELQHSGFGDATVRQALDMTTGLEYGENYADPNADVWRFAKAANLLPRAAGDTGPRSTYEFLATIAKGKEHGLAFSYKSPNAEVIGWLIRRVTGQRFEKVLSDRLWRPLGMEHGGYMQVDASGSALVAGGLNLRLRDLARFCDMMRQGGRFNGRQVVPEPVVALIARGGDRAQFAKAGYKTLPGWSYRDQWWVSHNDHGAYTARGVHGQTCYIDPLAEMSIVRFASFPLAANANLDPTSLPAYQALAEYLMTHKR